MLHLYIGDGKGKTTAALGLALRAAGAGEKVYFCQFLKDSRFACCESVMLKKCSIKLTRFKRQTHPLFDKEGKKMFATKKSIDTAFLSIEKIIAAKGFGMVVLDEVLNAWGAGLVHKDRLCSIATASKGMELILTGRNAPKTLIEMADYVSLIKKVKHPFDKKTFARKGIEY
jgi:cob(I)alamin adenosyltransferase